MSAKTLPTATRHAAGIAARKQLARSAHAVCTRKHAAPTALALLAASDAGRVPALVTLKYQRMAASPFAFFRGAAPVMAADLAAHPSTGLVTQICGDAHVMNLGAFASADGRLVFDVNDFDETIRAPFEWDVKRMATSLVLAGREAGIRRPVRNAAVLAFVAEYRRSMRMFAAMPVLELARFQVHRLAAIAEIREILRTAQRSTPDRSRAALTVDASGGVRRFKTKAPVLTRVGEAEARRVLDSLLPYARTLQPERRHFLAQYRPVDVAFKVVGVGSVGLRDYCIYCEGNTTRGSVDPLFLQVKEETASAYAPYLAENAGGRTHNGHRVVDGQRAMQLTSDPLLGYTSIDGRDYLVRQLNDHKASLDLSTLKAEGLLAYAGLCGEILARGHARAGDAIAIAAYLGKSDVFDKSVLAFARGYADQTEHDWKRLTASMKARGQKVLAKQNVDEALPAGRRRERGRVERER